MDPMTAGDAGGMTAVSKTNAREVRLLKEEPKGETRRTSSSSNVLSSVRKVTSWGLAVTRETKWLMWLYGAMVAQLRCFNDANGRGSRKRDRVWARGYPGGGPSSMVCQRLGPKQKERCRRPVALLSCVAYSIV